MGADYVQCNLINVLYTVTSPFARKNGIHNLIHGFQKNARSRKLINERLISPLLFALSTWPSRPSRNAVKDGSALSLGLVPTAGSISCFNFCEEQSRCYLLYL